MHYIHERYQNWLQKLKVIVTLYIDPVLIYLSAIISAINIKMYNKII